MRAVLGLGSNLGDRIERLREAVRQLSTIAKLEKLSNVYETAPVGGPEQPDYLNAAVLVSFQGEPLGLLDKIQLIESNLGRVRNERWGARTVDLDILWIEGVECVSERLTVPHPRLLERAFALLPLRDVAAEAIDPRTGAFFPQIDSSGVRKTLLSIGEEARVTA